MSTSSATASQTKDERAPGLSWSPVLNEGHRSRPGMKRNESSASSNGEGSRSHATSFLHSSSKKVNMSERILVQVTEDNERFSVVDITGLNTAAAIKEKMMSKLRELNV